MMVVVDNEAEEEEVAVEEGLDLAIRTKEASGTSISRVAREEGEK